MNYWHDLGIEDKIEQVLRDVPYAMADHDLGRPFLTAYQLAIEYAVRYPDDVTRIGLPVGGEGVGQRNSLAQYLAGQLSRRIRDGWLEHIEIAFLSNRHLRDVSFTSRGEVIHSSLTTTQYPLSMFWLRS